MGVLALRGRRHGPQQTNTGSAFFAVTSSASSFGYFPPSGGGKTQVGK